MFEAYTPVNYKLRGELFDNYALFAKKNVSINLIVAPRIL